MDYLSIIVVLYDLLQLGKLVLQNTGADDWEFKECHFSCGCFVSLVSLWYTTLIFLLGQKKKLFMNMNLEINFAA